MFRTQAIILKKTSLHPTRTLVILFTKEYGKVHAWYRKAPHEIGDTGAIVDTFLDRRGGVTFLSKCSLIKTLIPLDHTYGELILLLELIRILATILPDGMPQEGIFDDYVCVYGSIENTEIFHRSITLFLFRLLKITGILNPEPFTPLSPLSAVYTHIDRVSMKRVLESDKISRDQLGEMNRHAYASLTAYM